VPVRGATAGPSGFGAPLAAGAAPAGDGTRWLAPEEVSALLDACGIRIADWRVTGSPAAAGRAAAELGGPVALKAISTGLVRKVDAGAVLLDLEGESAVRGAAGAMTERLGAAGWTVDGFLVQRMVPAGTEMLVGVVHDRLFGPVIACGAGGTEVAQLRDVGVRITPLTDRDARELVGGLDVYPSLVAQRVDGPRDVAALEETLLRVSAMVEAHPQIVEMDLNPVIVLQDGAVVVDARVRIELPARPGA
jgi:acyl-CoA synthetase (NDP forming)